MTYQDFIEKHRITLTYEYIDSNPHMDGFEGDHYKVTLKRPIPGRQHPALSQLSVPFSKGYGHKGVPPTAEDVLECLRSDACTDGDTFEEFCFSLGYDSDSRKAEKLYKAVQRQTDKLRRFLGADLFTELLQTEED